MNNINIMAFYSKGYENVILEVKGTQQFLGKKIPVIYGGFGSNQKVVLAKTIAEIHEVEVKYINQVINRNISRFKEHIDIIDLKSEVAQSNYENLNYLGFNQNSINRANNIYLLSERGYAKLIKIMDSDLAWEIHDQLMDEYFSMREERENPKLTIEEIMIAQLQEQKRIKQQQALIEQQVQTVEQRMTNFEENAPLEPGEYNLVCSRVSSRVHAVLKERGINRDQIGELFKALNRDIKEITGIKTRTQLRKRHLNMVLDFINDWQPSRATMITINQMSLGI